MEVALYVRVSTSRQQQTQTIEQQLDRLRAHVAGHPEWHLAEEHIYRDDGYSGAQLNRPGLDRLRDQAALGSIELVLVTAPDRLARKYVHQVLLVEELRGHGCQLEFLDRPMSDDPHDQLLLQIRGAVAEYERSLIADRMRRGRQAKMRSGLLLPWTVAPYGYILDPERPRDANRVRVDLAKAEVVKQIFAWYTDPAAPATLYWVAKTLSDRQLPTPSGGVRWNVASVHGIGPGAEAVGHPQDGGPAPDGVPNPPHHALDQICLALGADFAPDEQACKHIHRRRNPDRTLLRLHIQFIALHLTERKVTLTYQLGLHPSGMATHAALPIHDRALIQHERKHDGLHWAAMRQQGGHHHQPTGIVQTIQRRPLALAEGSTTGATAQASFLS